MEGDFITEINTIDETVRMAGWGRRKAMKREIDFFKGNYLQEDEELLEVGAYSERPLEHLIYVTDRRVFVNKHEKLGMHSKLTEIPIVNITSINLKSKVMTSDIEIVASNNEASIESVWSHVADIIKKKLDTLRYEQKPSD